MSSSAFPRFPVSPFPSLRALSVSRPVHTALGQPRVGQVLAAFTRSCYVDLGGRIVALVTPVLLNGPLNIVVDAITLHDRVVAGETAACTDRLLRAGSIEIELTGAAVWDAALPPWTGEQISRLRDNLPTLRGLLQTDAPEGGLARIVTGQVATTALEMRAAPAIHDLAVGLQHRDAFLVGRAAGALAGLGPGLTPSGDDVLVGCLLTLALRVDTADLLRDAIVSGVRDRTTRISIAYLDAAARGEASEAWHRLIGTLTSNEAGRIADAARQVIAVGETSGSDMLAGFVLAAQALLRTIRCPGPGGPGAPRARPGRPARRRAPGR